MKKILFIICTFIALSVNAETIIADFSNVTSSSKLSDFPEGWTYITNNPKYPNPDYNKGANKFNFINEGVLSPQFNNAKNVSITMNVALNQNTKTSAGGENVFTIYGLNNGDTIVTTYENEVKSGDNVYMLNGQIDQILIKFTAYPYNGEKYCNVAVYKIILNTKEVPTSLETNSIQATPIKVLEDGKIYIYNNGHKYTITGQTIN